MVVPTSCRLSEDDRIGRGAGTYVLAQWDLSEDGQGDQGENTSYAPNAIPTSKPCNSGQPVPVRG